MHDKIISWKELITRKDNLINLTYILVIQEIVVCENKRSAMQVIHQNQRKPRLEKESFFGQTAFLVIPIQG